MPKYNRGQKLSKGKHKGQFFNFLGRNMSLSELRKYAEDNGIARERDVRKALEQVRIPVGSNLGKMLEVGAFQPPKAA